MFSLLILAAAAFALAAPVQNATCASGVHVIAARGTTNAPGEGPLQQVSSLIGLAVPGSTDVGVIYPAVYWPYAASLAYGVGNMTEEIQAYTTSCPNTKLILLGYSQGAQVIGDVLGGGSQSKPIDRRWMKNVIAALQYADPAHVKGKSYDVGTGTKSGRFARKNTTAIDSYADILQSYCDSNDVFCDSGLSAEVHEETVPNHMAASVEFVVKKFMQSG